MELEKEGTLNLPVDEFSFADESILSFLDTWLPVKSDIAAGDLDEEWFKGDFVFPGNFSSKKWQLLLTPGKLTPAAAATAQQSGTSGT